MGVPYCIIKGKARLVCAIGTSMYSGMYLSSDRLGTLVHKKTATAIAVTQVKRSVHLPMLHLAAI